MKAIGVQDSKQTGGNGDMLMGEREVDNTLPGDTTAGQNATQELQRG